MTWYVPTSYTMLDQSVFEEQLWRLNESGSFMDTLNRVELQLSMGYVDRHGNPITFDFLVNQYKAYQAWWEAKYGDRDQKYVKSSESLKSIYDYMGDQMYQQDWKPVPKVRDFYLFGNHTTAELNDSLRKFKNSIQKA